MFSPFDSSAAMDQPKYQPQMHWWKRAIVSHLLVGLCILGSTGCRVFRGAGRETPLANARQLSLRGADALDRQRFQDAECLFSEAIQQCSQDERAHWGYAETLWQRGKRAEAIVHMQQAVQLSTRNTEYMIRLGEMQLSVNNLQAAKAQADAAIAEDHRSARAFALLGNVHRASHEWDLALESYQRALLIQPDYAEVQLSAAELYRQVGRPQRSLATLDRMVDLHPAEYGAAEGMIIRGMALADLGQKEEAISVLNRAADRLNLERPDRFLQVATAQYRLGELVQARMTLGRVLQQFPEHEEAKRLQSNLDLSFQHLATPVMSPDAPLVR